MATGYFCLFVCLFVLVFDWLYFCCCCYSFSASSFSCEVFFVWNVNLNVYTIYRYNIYIKSSIEQLYIIPEQFSCVEHSLISIFWSPTQPFEQFLAWNLTLHRPKQGLQSDHCIKADPSEKNDFDKGRYKQIWDKSGTTFNYDTLREKFVISPPSPPPSTHTHTPHPSTLLSPVYKRRKTIKQTNMLASPLFFSDTEDIMIWRKYQ